MCRRNLRFTQRNYFGKFNLYYLYRGNSFSRNFTSRRTVILIFVFSLSTDYLFLFSFTDKLNSRVIFNLPIALRFYPRFFNRHLAYIMQRFRSDESCRKVNFIFLLFVLFESLNESCYMMSSTGLILKVFMKLCTGRKLFKLHYSWTCKNS